VVAVFLLICVPFTVNGVWPAVTLNWADLPATAAQALGAAVMWFALIAAVSAWIPGRGGAITGLSWPLFLILASLQQLTRPVWLMSVVHTLNYLNPLLYIGILEQGDGRNKLGMPLEFQLVFVWFVAAVCCGIAIAGWNRQEI
jgi:hypothetical protein